MSSEETKKDDKPTTAILYTDGGFKADYKLGGWGIHGYRYIDEPPKKGSGNPKAIPTRLGYASEENKDTAKRVTPTHYIDGVGCVQEATSCNQTELVAVINGMKHVLDSDIQTCILYSDSENTLKGLTQRLPRWKASGWRLGDGEEVKNRSLWEEADLLLSKLNEQAKSITFKHISGHAGHFGNELSDDWARKGNALGVRGINYSVIKETDAQGYWKVDHEPPRLLGGARWYFSTADRDYVAEDGSYIYYLGENGGDDEQTGKPMAENSQAVVFLKEPDPVLEALRQDAIEKDARCVGRLVLGRLDTIFASKVYDELCKEGVKFLEPDKRSLGQKNSKKKPVLVEKTPIGLGYNAIANLHALEMRLRDYFSNKPYLIRTDIKGLIYDTEVKKDKTVYKLSKDIQVSTKCLDIPLRYCLKLAGEISGQDDPDIKCDTVRLVLGRDLPRRSVLAGFAEECTQIEVVAWRESDKVIRFATIMRTQQGYGIWSATDSNMLYIKKS